MILLYTLSPSSTAPLMQTGGVANARLGGDAPSSIRWVATCQWPVPPSAASDPGPTLQPRGPVPGNPLVPARGLARGCPTGQDINPDTLAPKLIMLFRMIASQHGKVQDESHDLGFPSQVKGAHAESA